jgi:hypothetical protein
MDFLHFHGITVSPQVLERMVVAAVDALPRTLYASNPDEELTAPERDALLRGGLDPSRRELGATDPLARTAADYAALLRRSRSVREAARMLAVHESRVRQRLNTRPPTLYGFKVGGEWRIPDFIFEGKRLVPGMEVVAGRLDPAIHPVGFFRWFTMPDPDLVLDDEDPTPRSPRSWLLAGYAIETVAALAAHL